MNAWWIDNPWWEWDERPQHGLSYFNQTRESKPIFQSSFDGTGPFNREPEPGPIGFAAKIHRKCDLSTGENRGNTEF